MTNTARITIPATTLDVYPLCLGGNVFGWSANESQSQGVLDAFTEGGGNFIDTADVYSEWVDGNVGGESETIIGNWMKARRNRHELVIATKVAKLSSRPGVTVDSIRAGGITEYQTDKGYAIIEALDKISKAHNSSISAVALAWLRANPQVSTPIASARTVEQLHEIMQIVALTNNEVAELSAL